jgi:NADH-quinone oxidoreductase subunit J
MSPFPFSRYALVAIFGFVVATTVGGALIAVLSRRIIRAVAGLALSCLGLAGLYYFLNSPFLALMEILIYIGAVCVTIIFGVMLSEPDEHAPTEKRGQDRCWAAVAALVSVAIFWGVAHLSLRAPWTPLTAAQSDGSVQAIGIALLTTYSLPFELISLVLMVAILGALTLARGGRSKS